MSILAKIDKEQTTQTTKLEPPPAGLPSTAAPLPVPLDRAAKDSLLARIRQTYPATVQAAQQAPTSPMVPNHKEAGPTPANPPDAKPAPFVTAVFEPAGFRGADDPGGYYFADSLSQAERKEAIEDFEWMARVDARKKREAEKNVNSTGQKTGG
jgi:hypothetical protein